jgi:hypothetical protein
MELDPKQQRLIRAWLAAAISPSGDEYGRFMAAWIAFNAFCYPLFAEKTSRRRPDLADDRGLVGLTGRVPAQGSLELRAEGRARPVCIPKGTCAAPVRPGVRLKSNLPYSDMQ